MPIAWFIVPYKRHPHRPRTRYPAIDDYTEIIRAHGGDWRETEILGNRALVKVRAPQTVLNTLAAFSDFKHIPKARLNEPLSDLSPAVLNALRDELLDQGYTMQQLRSRFGSPPDLTQYSLGDVLRFMASQRRKPRYDRETDTIIVDGDIQTPKPVDVVDWEVGE